MIWTSLELNNYIATREDMEAFILDWKFCKPTDPTSHHTDLALASSIASPTLTNNQDGLVENPIIP